MRKRNWLASLLGSALWMTGVTVGSAQEPYVPAAPGSMVPPAGAIPYADPYGAGAGAQPYFVPNSGMQPAGMPPGATAWPQISPYMNPYQEQHKYDDGFWFKKQLQRDRQYYVNLQATFNNFGGPKPTTVGNNRAPAFTSTTATGTGGAGTAATGRPATSTTGGGGGGGGGTGAGRTYFNSYTWDDVEGPLTSGGFMGQAGWFESDGSGWFVNGFFADEGRAELRIESNPLIRDFGTPVDLGGNRDLDSDQVLEYLINLTPERSLQAYAGIPLDDGVQNDLLDGFISIGVVGGNQAGGGGGGGTAGVEQFIQLNGRGTQPYDAYYRLFYQSQAYGTGAGWYSAPVFESGSFKVRPTAGLRYLNVRENAVFEGGDSALAYTIDLNIYRPGTGTGGGGGGTAAVTANPANDADGDDQIEFLFESRLRSNTKAQLAGPEIGFRLDMGGENFLVYTQTKLGILANHSTRELDGYGIGRAGIGLAGGNIPIEDISQLRARGVLPQTAFHEQDSTTTVSPTFEQSIAFRAPLLSYVPGIRKLKVFEKAEFTAGYTLLVVGAIYRPGDVIEWNGYPNFPQITGQKSTFLVHSANWGVEWGF
jgi:hypothetical protein